ncbi:kelch repeat-containing protein 1-like [Acipenser oxyrinchus oxyrinchus]|uniref:Kelch repeat-containing protein 1-like n=1 Tax=Acipenser oxyrinchus oxyrinchus TaxID=40147 RepID=A0AAD8FPD6_ACIOX|nr:kelch repeat-containing protein 1-like [Acipenser oxyrinchus oxyrinchus]
MGKVSFYVLWSLRDAPRQLISKFNRLCYQSQVPLPLPKQLVVFSLGDWRSYSGDTSITVEVSVSPDVTPQKIGRLSAETRCLVWEGNGGLIYSQLQWSKQTEESLVNFCSQSMDRLKPVLPAALQCPPGNGSI